MNVIRQENQDINILNYLAIISLETVGNVSPTQTEISAMEKVLTLSLQASVERYRQIKTRNDNCGLSTSY